MNNGDGKISANNRVNSRFVQSLKIRPSHPVPRKLEIPSASGAIAWSADGQRIAVANLDDNIAIAKLSDLKPGFMGGFYCLAWHPQGHKLAAGGQAGEVLIWKRDDSEG